MIYQNLSALYYKSNQFDQALKMNDMACQAVCQYFSSDHIQLLSLYNDLGDMYFMRNDDSQALEHYAKALEIGLKLLPVNHRELVEIYKNIDQVYNRKHRNSNSSDHLSTGQEYSSLTSNIIGNIFYKMNNYEKALLYYCYAYQLELRMPSLNRLLIEEYQKNITKSKNQYPKSIVRSVLKSMYTIYEYFTNDG